MNPRGGESKPEYSGGLARAHAPIIPINEGKTDRELPNPCSNNRRTIGPCSRVTMSRSKPRPLGQAVPPNKIATTGAQTGKPIAATATAMPSANCNRPPTRFVAPRSHHFSGSRACGCPRSRCDGACSSSFLMLLSTVPHPPGWLRQRQKGAGPDDHEHMNSDERTHDGDCHPPVGRSRSFELGAYVTQFGQQHG